jgi:hypothetical protein
MKQGGTKILLEFVLLLILSVPMFGQNKWVVKSDNDGIRISQRKSEKTIFDDIRVELDVPGKLEQLEVIILDVNKYSQWICSTKKTVLVKQLEECRCIYYTEVSAPWPFSDRYYYSDLTLERDSLNHSFHAVTKSIDGYKPETNGLVKISYTSGLWDVSRKSANCIHIDYVLELNPGNFMPAWFFNKYAINGPLETFENVRKKMMALNHL